MVGPPDSQFCTAALYCKPAGAGLNNRQHADAGTAPL